MLMEKFNHITVQCYSLFVHTLTSMARSAASWRCLLVGLSGMASLVVAASALAVAAILPVDSSLVIANGTKWHSDLLDTVPVGNLASAEHTSVSALTITLRCSTLPTFQTPLGRFLSRMATISTFWCVLGQDSWFIFSARPRNRSATSPRIHQVPSALQCTFSSVDY